jgi:hypothetical protein
MLKHLKPHEVPSTTKIPIGLTITEAVQAIIVDCVAAGDPQLTSIVGNNTVPVMAAPRDSHASCPTHSEMISPFKTRPVVTRIPIPNHLTPTSHVRFPTVQIWNATTLPEVEGVFPEEACAIDWAMF